MSVIDIQPVSEPHIDYIHYIRKYPSLGSAFLDAKLSSLAKR